jgi:hypothetical protein
MPINLAIQEPKSRRIMVESQSRQIVYETLSQKQVGQNGSSSRELA